MHHFKHFKRIKLTFTERLFAVAVLAVTLQLSFPQYSHAAVPIDRSAPVDFSDAFIITVMQSHGETIAASPTPVVFSDAREIVVAPAKARRVIWVMVTAYSSEPRQTDGSPYITAKNTFVRDGVVAANFLPFSTRLRVPQYFGDKEFIVEDRMNARYWERIDIWMPTREEAKQWGARWVKVEVL